MRYSSVRVGEIIFANEYFFGWESDTECHNEMNDSHEAISVDHLRVRVNVAALVHRCVWLCDTEC